MKRIVVVAAVLLVSGVAHADKYVQGHVNKNGTYVEGHYQSDSNNTVMDNYSHKGNYNPYTGQSGSNYDRNSPSSDYYGTQPSRRSNSGYDLYNNSPYGQ